MYLTDDRGTSPTQCAHPRQDSVVIASNWLEDKWRNSYTPHYDDYYYQALSFRNCERDTE